MINIANRTIVGAFLRLTFIFLSFVLTILLSRFLGIDDFGSFSYLFAVLTIMLHFIRGGWPQFVVREVSIYSQSGDNEKLSSVTIFSVRWIIYSIILMSVLLILDYLIFKSIFDQLYMYIVIILSLVFSSVVFLLSALNRGVGNIIFGQIPELFLFPSVNIAIVSAIYLHPSLLLTVNSALMSIMISFVIVSLITVLYTRTYIRLVIGKFNQRHKREWLSSVARIGVVSLSGIAMAQIPLVIIGIQNTSAATAEFRVAFQISALVLIGLAVANLNLAPAMNQCSAKQNWEKLQELALFSCRISVIPGAIICLTILIFDEDIVRLAFGVDYMGSVPTLKLLALGQLLNAAFGSVGVMIVAIRREKTMLTIQVASISVLTILSYLSVPHFGAIGAAFGYVISLSIWNISLFYILYKNTKVRSLPL